MRHKILIPLFAITMFSPAIALWWRLTQDRGTNEVSPVSQLVDRRLDAARHQSEEYAIYAAVLGQGYLNGSRVLIIRKACSSSTGNPWMHLDRGVKGMFQTSSNESCEDFSSRFEEGGDLVPARCLAGSVILLGVDEGNRIFEDAHGWENFYRRFPEAPGLIELSRVGFNALMDEAIVYVGMQSGGLAGSGYLNLLRRIGGVWEIVESVKIWIS